MRICKWTPNFHVDVESSIAPISVSFHYLPKHFFSKQSLFSIGKALGIKMDAATVILARPSVARINIVIDLLKNYLFAFGLAVLWVDFGNKITCETSLISTLYV